MLVDSLVNEPLCLVLGSQGTGLSETSREVLELVSTPMLGQLESLTVSVATGSFLDMLHPQNHRSI